MQSDEKRQEIDAIKRAITAETLAGWIAQKTGEKVHRSGNGWRVGKGRSGGSIKIDDSGDGPIINDFAGGPKGDCISVIQDIGQCDFNSALQIARELSGSPISTVTQEQKPKPSPIVHVTKHWEQLRRGLESHGCMHLMELRGLDKYKIQEAPNVGYTDKETPFYNDVKIPTNSLVFRDSKGRFKFIEFGPDGHRTKLALHIPGAGDCMWTPMESIPETGDLIVCEGEMGAASLYWDGLQAIPCKPEREGIEVIKNLGSRCILAYDNDNQGRNYTANALKINPDAIDISGLWSSQEWNDKDDPNDFVARLRKNGGCIRDAVTGEIERLRAERAKAKADAEKADADQKAILESLKTVGDVLEYLKSKNDTRTHSDCSTRFYKDELFGNFCYSLDPYGIRRFAPVACLVAYAVARLAKYTKHAGGRILTEQRIINLCGALKSGKDWVLGTTSGSHSLAHQLRTEKECYSVSVDNAPPTGNGLARYALEFAANDQNKGLVKVIIHPESGNALTQGYDAAKRAGSLSSFDIGLSNRRVDVPKTGTALKDFKDYHESYDFEGVCVRAFQNVNAQKVIIPRFAGGGESRREMWFAITHPVNDDMCNDKNGQLFEDVLGYSFDPESCDTAFDSLKKSALPFEPMTEYFDTPPKDTINIDTGCEVYNTVYYRLLETVTNPYFKQDKSALIRSQFQFAAALCAGLHGRYDANDDDYWCAGYIVEVLSRSLDMIAEWDNRPENTETLHAQILGYVERAGASGVRADSVFRKFPDGKRAISELLAGDDGDGAPIFRMIDAQSKKGNAFYFASQFRDAVEKDDRFRMPMK